MKTLRCFFLIAILLALPASALAIGMEVALGSWSEEPSGNLSYQALTFVDSIDLESEAGYDKESKVYGRVKIDMPLVLPNIYFLATPLDFEGTGTKSVNFRFGDLDFDADVPFISKLEMNHYDLGLYYGVPFLSTATLGRLDVEAGLNIRYIDLKASVDQASSGLTESTSETIYLPMLYLAAMVRPVDWLAIEAEGRGISISDNHYYDIIARLKFKPFGPFFGAVGWRHEDIQVDESDIVAELQVSGPFFEAGVTF